MPSDHDNHFIHDVQPHPLRVTREAEPLRAFEVQHVGDEIRRRHNVAAIKIPHAHRDVARAVMPDDAAVEDRRYVPGLGSDTPDHDREFRAGDPTELDGTHVWYSLMLTDEEAERFRAASNARAVTLDVEFRPI